VIVTSNNPEQASLLLVEDNPGDVFLVRHVIREEGLKLELKVAEDGEKAIQIIDRLDDGCETSGPELMLLDLNIPRRTGIQVLERLRRSVRYGKIPVVMISSSDSPGERQHALDVGATEYFHKPSNLAGFMQLGKLVRRLHEQACNADN
jgi:chemotaxis family two-component system response regulator Rcp1